MINIFQLGWFRAIIENGVQPKFICIYNSLWLDMDIGGGAHLYIRPSDEYYKFVTHTTKYGTCSVSIMCIGDILDEVKDSGADLKTLNPAWTKLMPVYGVITC